MKKLLSTVAAFALCMAANSQSLNFDGVDDYVGVGNVLPSSYTKEAWIMMSADNGANNIIGGGDNDGAHTLWAPGYILQAGHNGNWGQVADNTPMNAGQWYHVAVSYDAGSQVMKLYKNGALVSTASSVGAYTMGNNVRIGAFNDASNLFTGNIDEVRIWSIVRTDNQIMDNMNCSISSDIGLIASYNFNEGVPNGTNTGVTTLTDGSGSGNDGTLNNFALTGTTSNWTDDVNTLNPTVSVSVAASSTVCVPGLSVTFTATPTYGGSNPVYQWKKNGSPVGLNSSTYIDNNLSNNDAITCEVTSSIACAQSNPGTSTPVVMTATVAALDFDGTDDQVNIPRPVSDDFTIEYWVKTTQTGGGSTEWYEGAGMVDGEVPGQTDDFGTSLVGSKACFGVGNPDISIFSTTNINDGAWHHIAATREKATGTMILYVDGVAEANTTGSTNSLTAPGGLTMGILQSGVNNFAGQLDEVRIWNVVRTANQIADNRSCSIASATGLVASYDFNDGIPNADNTGMTTLIDVTGNGNNGALSNFTLNGTSSNWVDNVTFPSVTPAVSISSSANAACSGVAVTFTAAPTNGGSTPAYQWKKNGSAVGTNSNTYSDNGLSTSDVISCNLTSSLGCGAGTATSNTISITITATPTVSITGPTSTCPGNTVTLVGSGATSYTWTVGTASIVTQTLTGVPNSTKTYTLTGANGSCTGTETITVVVNPTPTVTIGGTTSICAGGSTILTASGATTYTWSANAGSATTASVSVSPSSTDTYTVTGDDGTCTSKSTINVIVTPIPTVSISGSSAICSGNSTVLTASGATNYTWSANAGSATTASVSVSPSSDDTYTVTGDDNGCTSVSTISVTVAASPTVSVSGTSAICSGNSTTLTASGATNYTWSANAGSATTTSVSVSPSADDTYTVTGEDNGCTATSTITVNVTATPTLNIAGPSSVCTGSSATLTASGAATYTWSANAGSANTATVSVSPTSSDTYTVSSDNSGCTGTETVTVNVNSLPSVTFDVNPNLVCSTDPAVTLSGTPSGGSFTGTGVSGSQFDPATAGVGTYTLTYMYSDVNNCSNSDTAVVTVQMCTTGLNSFSSQNVVVYPNPAKNTLHLQNLSAEITSVEIYNNIGQKVMSQFSQFENIDITSLADGIYQVRVLKGSAAIGQVKFVKQY